VREADLRNRLDNPQGDEVDEPDATIPAPETKSFDGQAEPKIVDENDYQLSQALNLLKGLQIIGNQQRGDNS